jgi:hypothetical protein
MRKGEERRKLFLSAEVLNGVFGFFGKLFDCHNDWEHHWHKVDTDTCRTQDSPPS